MNAQAREMLEAAAQGDFTVIYKALGAAMPFEEFKRRQERMWRQRREQLGEYRSVTVLGTSVQPNGYMTTARLDFDRGSDYVQFIWAGPGKLGGIRNSRTAPGTMLYPQSATEFVSFDISTGESLGLSFVQEGNRYKVTVRRSVPVSKAGEPESNTLPDNVAGRVGAAYIKAFNSKDEKVMRAFLESNLSSTSLASRSMDYRLQIFQRMRGDMGDLTIGSFKQNGELGLSVTCQTATGRTAEFVFDLDPKEPQRLKSLRVDLR